MTLSAGLQGFGYIPSCCALLRCLVNRKLLNYLVQDLSLAHAQRAGSHASEEVLISAALLIVNPYFALL